MALRRTQQLNGRMPSRRGPTPRVWAPRIAHQMSRSCAQVSSASFVEYADATSAPNLKVEVHGSDDEVAVSLVSKVESAAVASINEKGSFTLAVPGGSVLKMLWGLSMNKSKVDWSKVYLFYVNHKCVPVDDPSSTHKKAVDYFLTNVGIPMENVAHLTGSPNAVEEASIYQDRLKKVATDLAMPTTDSGVPRFDMMLIGMGSDGHVGSLYPQRPETVATDGWVLSVDKKEPNSITLSAPVMSAAKEIIISMTGSSKAKTVQQALEIDLAPGDLPVQMIKPHAGSNVTWLMDAGAASELALSKASKALRAM